METGTKTDPKWEPKTFKNTSKHSCEKRCEKHAKREALDPTGSYPGRKEGVHFGTPPIRTFYHHIAIYSHIAILSRRSAVADIMYIISYIHREI